MNGAKRGPIKVYNFEEINDFEACGRIVGFKALSEEKSLPKRKETLNSARWQNIFTVMVWEIEIGINGQLVSFLVRPTTTCRLDDLLCLPLRPRVWTSGRASAPHAEGPGWIPRSSHTKDFKNGTYCRCA